jgi:hypothetical protein
VVASVSSSISLEVFLAVRCSDHCASLKSCLHCLKMMSANRDFD